MLVSKTKAWEKERGMEFRYDGVCLVLFLQGKIMSLTLKKLKFCYNIHKSLALCLSQVPKKKEVVCISFGKERYFEIFQGY